MPVRFLSVKATSVKRNLPVEQPEKVDSSDPILPLAVAYVLAIVVLTAICTYFSGDVIVSLVLFGFGLTGAIKVVLHVLSFLSLFKRPPVMPQRPRKIAGLWRSRR